MFYNILFEFRVKFIYTLFSFFTFLFINSIYLNIILYLFSVGQVYSFYSFTPQNDFYSISSFLIFFTFIMWFPYFLFFFFFSILKGIYKYEFIRYFFILFIYSFFTFLSLVLTICISSNKFFYDLFVLPHFSSTLLTSLDKWLNLILTFILFFISIFGSVILFLGFASSRSAVLTLGSACRKFYLSIVLFILLLFPNFITLIFFIIFTFFFELVFVKKISRKLLGRATHPPTALGAVRPRSPMLVKFIYKLNFN